MKSRFYRLSLLSIMLGTLSLNATLADDVATHNVTTGNIAVSFADLNLASPTGLANLYQRVQSAAVGPRMAVGGMPELASIRESLRRPVRRLPISF